MTLKFVVVALLPAPVAAAATQRLRAIRRHDQNSHRCPEHKGIQFLETDSEFANQTVFYDGFSRVACEVDASPSTVRISFKEHACGGEVSSCRLTTLPMEPRLCFDFCRTQKSAKFFGLVHGRDCYCTTYFHSQSTGGQGVCDAHCEGDQNEMCGGMEKSSLFEMHLCGDSADEAHTASARAVTIASSVEGLTKEADDTVDGLRNMSKAWTLGVCSLAPEGQRVCALNQVWLRLAEGLGDASGEAKHAAEVLMNTSSELDAIKANATAAGESISVDLAAKLEKTTHSLNAFSNKASGTVALIKSRMASVKGPMAGDKIDSFGDTLDAAKKVFAPLGDVNASWHGVCALEGIPGETFAAMQKSSDYGPCARRCVSLSTGTEACVAFNYQFINNIASCQLLKEKGLTQPKDRIAKAVPIFEVSDDKMKAMGLSELGCYAKTGFMGAHPHGPLATDVIKEVSVTG